MRWTGTWQDRAACKPHGTEHGSGLGLTTEGQEGTATASVLPGAQLPQLFINKYALVFLKSPAFGSSMAVKEGSVPVLRNIVFFFLIVFFHSVFFFTKVFESRYWI